jgi:ubiquinone/menaquinone biosynthesis C-methylase UbiE
MTDSPSAPLAASLPDHGLYHRLRRGLARLLGPTPPQATTVDAMIRPLQPRQVEKMIEWFSSPAALSSPDWRGLASSVARWCPDLPPQPGRAFRQVWRRLCDSLPELANLERSIGPRYAEAFSLAAVRVYYESLSPLDAIRPAVTFLNLGLADLDPEDRPVLKPDDELDRYSIQLYHHLARTTPLDGKDVLEVGCGRGGGASYLRRYFPARTVTGMDFSAASVAYCQRAHADLRAVGLSFEHGNAMSLPFPAARFDVVINVESAHGYPSIPGFFAEVARVLRPGGTFLYTDTLPSDVAPKIRGYLSDAGLDVVTERDVGPAVMRAIELEESRKLAQYKVFVGHEARVEDVYGTQPPASNYQSLVTGARRYVTMVATRRA